MADIIRYYYTVQKPANLREAAAAAQRAAEQPLRARPSRPPRRPRAPDTVENGEAADEATSLNNSSLPNADSGAGWFRDAIAVAVGRKMRAAAGAVSSAPVDSISDESALIELNITFCNIYIQC